MDLQSLNSALSTFGTRFFTVANANPKAEISACPGWSMQDLVGHVGNVYATVEKIISADSTEPPSNLLITRQKVMYFIGLKVIFTTL